MYGSDKIARVPAENFSRFLKMDVSKWGRHHEVVVGLDHDVYPLWPEAYHRSFPEVYGYGNEAAAAASSEELIELLQKGEIVSSHRSGYASRPLVHFKHFHIRYGRMEVILKIQFYDW